MNDTSRAGGDEELPRDTTAARETEAQADTEPHPGGEAHPGTEPAADALIPDAAEPPAGADRDTAGGTAAGGASATAGASTGAAAGSADVPPKDTAAPRRPSIGSQAEQDAIFAALVAQFDDPVDLNNPEWPEIENLRAQNERKRTTTDPDLADFAPRPRPRQNPGQGGTGQGSPAGPRDYQAAEDPDEGHFVPPEPPPLPPADTTAKFAWLAVLGGPALLLFDALVWREVSGWPAWVGITAFLGGFATLVARMKSGDDEDEGPHDPNDGAVV